MLRPATAALSLHLTLLAAVMLVTGQRSSVSPDPSPPDPSPVEIALSVVVPGTDGDARPDAPPAAAMPTVAPEPPSPPPEVPPPLVDSQPVAPPPSQASAAPERPEAEQAPLPPLAPPQQPASPTVPPRRPAPSKPVPPRQPPVAHEPPARSVPAPSVPTPSVPAHSVPAHSVPAHSVPAHSVPAPSINERALVSPTAPGSSPAPVRTPADAVPQAGSPGAPRQAAAELGEVWRGALAAWLQAHRTYPDAARQDGVEGRVIVRFTMDRNGTVLEVALVRSSGSTVLDDAAVAMLRGAHLPPPPQASDRISITLPIRYSLSP